GLIEHVRAEQIILLRMLMIHAAGKKVLVDHLLSCESEQPKISVAPGKWVLGQRVKGQISRRVRIYGYVPVGKNPITRVLRRYGRNGRDALRLPDPFVVDKEECSVLQDRSADGFPKLVALEGWSGLSGIIEEVPRVEVVIPEELIGTAVNLICSGAR